MNQYFQSSPKPFPVNDSGYFRLRYPKDASDFCLVHSLLKQFNYLYFFWVYFVIVVIPPFIRRIFQIVSARAKPQMGWINTSSIISTRTIVQDCHSFRYRSKVQNPTRPVCRNTTAIFSFHYLPISVGSTVSPDPARISKTYFGEKPSRKSWRKTLRFEEFWSYVRLLHKQVVLFCGRALGGTTREGFSFLPHLAISERKI